MVTLPNSQVRSNSFQRGDEHQISWMKVYTWSSPISWDPYTQAGKALPRKDNVKGQEQWTSLHFYGLR